MKNRAMIFNGFDRGIISFRNGFDTLELFYSTVICRKKVEGISLMDQKVEKRFRVFVNLYLDL